MLPLFDSLHHPSTLPIYLPLEEIQSLLDSSTGMHLVSPTRLAFPSVSPKCSFVADSDRLSNTSVEEGEIRNGASDMDMDLAHVCQTMGTSMQCRDVGTGKEGDKLTDAENLTTKILDHATSIDAHALPELPAVMKGDVNSRVSSKVSC